MRRIRFFLPICALVTIVVLSLIFLFNEPQLVTRFSKQDKKTLLPLRKAYNNGSMDSRTIALKSLAAAKRAESKYSMLSFYKGSIVMAVKSRDFDLAEQAYTDMTNKLSLGVHAKIDVLTDALDNVESTSNLAKILDQNICFLNLQDLLKRLQNDPNDVLLNRRVADCYVILDDWGQALLHYSKSGGEYAKVAKFELSGKNVDWKGMGDFWWLESNDIADLLHEGFREHARYLYEKSADR